jgi:S1-C subfamily serine protease
VTFQTAFRISSTRRFDPTVLLLGALALAAVLFGVRPGAAAAPPIDFAVAAERVDPSCVGILGRGTGRSGDRGAGFVLRPGGIVVTAAHVVAGVGEIGVRLADGGEVAARVIGVDELSDVAVLRVPADPPPIAVAPAGTLRRGAAVAAIGDPLGFAATLTVGHVSSPARPFDETSPYELVQHDAALNPGSSGGPLIDAEGRVVAMNVAIADGARRHVGIGLALPIEVVERIADRLLADGALARPRLGLRLRAAATLRSAIPSLAAGIVVEAVEPASPAAAAGLEPGDLLVAAGGRRLERPRDLALALETLRPGDELRLTTREVEGERTVTVRLAAATRPQPSAEAPEAVALGLDLEPGASRRIAAVAPDTPAGSAGLAVGDELLAVSGRRVEGEGGASLLRAAEASPAPGGVALLVRRGDTTRLVVLGPRGRLDADAPFGSNAEALSSHLF